MNNAECITVVCDFDKMEDLKCALRSEEELVAGKVYALHIFSGYWSGTEDAEADGG